MSVGSEFRRSDVAGAGVALCPPNALKVRLHYTTVVQPVVKCRHRVKPCTQRTDCCSQAGVRAMLRLPLESTCSELEFSSVRFLCEM